jgi:thimet oligopeptidase
MLTSHTRSRARSLGIALLSALAAAGTSAAAATASAAAAPAPAASAAARSAAAAPSPASDRRAWESGDSTAALEAWVDRRLKHADEAVAKLLAVKGPRTVNNTLALYDDAFATLLETQAQSQMLYGVGATKELRDKAQSLTQTANAAFTALTLNPDVYHALAAVPAPSEPGTRHYLERTLLEYRLAGVDKDEATRARIRQLQDKIIERGLAFERTVHDDVRTVVVDKSQLSGLPPDFLASRKPDANGKVRITTDPPDLNPALKFADNAQLRHELWLAAHAVGFPANTAILRSLLEARAELAQVLGYLTWADLAMADQMMTSPAKLAEFVKKVDEASREPAARENAALLKFVQEKEPSVKEIPIADLRYWQEQYRRARFEFDSQSVRPYFPFAAVERGVLDTASRLFHVQIRPVTGLKTWHPSVTTYEVFEGSTKLGTIYLDMHPREGKDKWFSTQPLIFGGRGRHLPEGALVCNFPGGAPDDPGLMQYGDVVIFLHEFGHLMHDVIGSQMRFAGESPINIEGDFIEAPSQMLEEFFHDYGALATFARHYQSGEVLPKELYERMTRADTFARASDQQRQLMFTAVSLDFHTMNPATLDFDEVWKRTFERFSGAAYMPGDHSWASFTHLNGYSSNYYTYVLDKVIALDFFAQFDPQNLIGGPTGMRYRQTVLAPGGSQPAADLVRNFLGRDTNLDAYRRWMLAEFASPATPASSTSSSAAR